MRFLLGSREVTSDDLDVYSGRGAHFGAAVFGASVGDTVSYAAPNGRTISVEIKSVEPYRLRFRTDAVSG